MDTKKCTKCSKVKAVELFNYTVARPDKRRVNQKQNTIGKKYYRGECLDCSRDIARARKYGISVEKMKEWLSAIHCDICGVEFDTDRSRPRDRDDKFIDHCHTKGHVRGVLCNTCNTMLGRLERKGMLIKTLKYIDYDDNEGSM